MEKGNNRENEKFEPLFEGSNRKNRRVVEMKKQKKTKKRLRRERRHLQRVKSGKGQSSDKIIGELLKEIREVKNEQTRWGGQNLQIFNK